MSQEQPFGGDLGWGQRPALVMVDLMRAYFTDGSPLCLPSRTSLDNAARLLAAARHVRLPIIHTRVRYGLGAVEAGLFIRKVPALGLLADDSAQPELRELMPEVDPRPTEIVLTKQYASAFFGTSLASTLTAAGVDTLVVAGVSTSGCIRATATDAMQHGFRPIVVSDACGDRTEALHRANLDDLNAKYADVTDLASALANLAGRAS